ncbi:CBS domain-containing protein [Luteibaculum oceani]|uniref:CBS domain-containing protein n=1 Tax=Luteibaculum oceani TaxID=1294296 RepID=A0A5C6V531_9FLAO|nr:CBS domain-containing protein [Luteibaculum oceani]TXC78908.1 CBS domain-containing protein [Luteibaculum oceani]
MLASLIVNPDILELYPNDTVEEALKAMERYLVRHLPVVDKGTLLGVVGKEQLLKEPADKKIDKLKGHLVEARLLAQMHFFECYKLFSKTDLSVVPIVDPDGVFIGVVTRSDLTKYMAENTGINEAGAIVVLTMPPKDYSLHHLAQMVEGNDAHILHAYCCPKEAKNELEVTLKLNTTRIGGVLQTFHRYGYTVLATFDKNNDTDYLNDRYEALLKYLNM